MGERAASARIGADQYHWRRGRHELLLGKHKKRGKEETYIMLFTIIGWMVRQAYGLLSLMSSPSFIWNSWATCFMITLLLYIVPHILLVGYYYYKSPRTVANLKKRYNAKWALVTGASSGIGKAMSERLAHYGCSVALVAVQDELLEKTFTELKLKYPKSQFRSIGVDLGKPGYMDDIKKKTEDINPTLIFCNAGYVLTGFFWETPVERQLANIECNATSAVSIAHHFVGKMIKSKLKGCIVFTSSAAAAMPSPFTCAYASTKAFLSAFGASLAAEVKSKGIDVCVIHPSPIASRFYDNTHKIDMLDFFKLFSVAPDTLPAATTSGSSSPSNSIMMASISLRKLCKSIGDSASDSERTD